MTATGRAWVFPDAKPYDDHVGPFPGEEFVMAWMESVGSGSPVQAAAPGAFLPLVAADGTVTIAGEPSLTDYHSPLGADPGSLIPQLLEIRESAAAVVLDSLPLESTRALEKAFGETGTETEVEEGEATAVVVVEGDYLDGLSKKQRHEVRRKHRRFSEMVGVPDLEVCDDREQAMDRFVELHRQSDGDKGEFLTAGMEEFFRRLYSSPGWEIAELRAGSRVAASLFGYRESDAYYLYNSAYNPEYREASPGVVALYMLIEHLVVSDCRRIDLLKGDEIYKFRMGATARPLHRISF
ncbi:MAG: GNAT family N-acetyltransferase [Acidimicrobiia bacterium]